MAIPLLSSEKSESPFEAKVSVLKNSDGSASWHSRGGSTVLTSVNGPIEVRIRDEVLGEATLELKILPAAGLAGTRERYLENLVRGALRPCLLLGLHPRSLLQITCQVISSNEETDSLDITASIINSVILACVDAGFSMRSMLAASLLRHPEHGKHVACYSYPKKELVMVESIGPFEQEQLVDILNSIEARCDEVFDIMKRCIDSHVERQNRWRGMMTDVS